MPGLRRYVVIGVRTCVIFGESPHVEQRLEGLWPQGVFWVFHAVSVLTTLVWPHTAIESDRVRRQARGGIDIQSVACRHELHRKPCMRACMSPKRLPSDNYAESKHAGREARQMLHPTVPWHADWVSGRSAGL